MKKFYSLIAILLCAVLSANAEVYEGECGGTLSWSLDTESGLLQISGYGNMSYSSTNAPWYDYRASVKEVSLPEKISAIGSYAFRECVNLKSIEFPDAVVNIGNSVCYGCSSLRKVTFGKNITSIGGFLFYGCNVLDTIVWNVKNYTISSSLSTPFYNYSSSSSSRWDVRSQIRSFTFGPDVETIPDYLCYGMTILNSPIVIPESVTSIGMQAFYNCTSIPELTLNKNIKTFNEEFYQCSALTKVYYTGTIEDWCNIKFNGATSNPLYYAGDLYINNELATDINIPESITEIGAYQFYNASCIKMVSLPSALTSVGQSAFNSCINLRTIEFPNKVSTINSNAFTDCSSLRKVTFGENLTSIGGYVLRGCNSLDTVVWNVKNYTISSSLSTPFYNYSSSSSSRWDVRSQIRSFTFGPNVETIPAYLCYGMISLNSPIVIPESVTSIGSQAFYNCTSIPELTLNKHIKTLNEEFYQCSALTKVYYTGTIGDWCNITFSNSTSNPLYYAGNLYINNELVTEINIPESITKIGSYQFINSINLEKITLPSAITSVGHSAFEGCINLRTIEFPNKVSTINSNALYGCSSLRKVTFGEDLTTIGGYVLRGCNSLDTVVWNVKNYNITSDNTTPFYNYSSSSSSRWDIRSQIRSFTFGPNVETIPAYLCKQMTQINTTTIPSKVTTIGEQAFYNCTSNNTIINNSALDIVKGAATHGYVAYYASDVYTGNDTIGEFIFAKSEDKDYLVKYLGHDCQITLPANYRGGSYGIASNVFRNYKTATSITIPNSVTSIGEYAFNGCSNLNVVYIGNSVISIGQAAFYGCSQLYKIIMLPNSVPDGINSAFESLSGRITYVGNTNYQSGYNVLGTKRVYSNLNSYFSVDGIVYALVNPSKRTCDIIDCDYSGTTTEFAVGNSVIYRNITLSVDSINIHAFRNNNMMTKMVVNFDHALPAYMAAYCFNLKNVVINNLSNIGYNAFIGCASIDTLIITSKGNIESYAFKNCSQNANAYYSINNKGYISYESFANCNKLYTLIVGDSVTEIKEKAFYQCDWMVKADISNNGEICQYAFQNCVCLDDVTIKNNGSIGIKAFEGSSTKTPATYRISNVGAIGESAFANCTSMKNLTIDTCVRSIGQGAFQKCINLEDVTIKNNGSIGIRAFEGASTKKPATYHISNVGQISASAFANCKSLNKAHLGNQISSIGQSAFNNCVLLDSVTMPNSISALGDSAFNNCRSLAFVKLSNKISTIGNAAFAHCHILPELFIPKSVNSIGNSTFRKCNSLAIVGFEDGENPLSLGRDSIDRGLFYDCPLDSVYIGRELSYTQTPAYGYSPFYRSPSLRSIVISDFPSKVENNEFYGCTNLYSVYIGNGVQSIGEYAFSGCSSIDYFSFGDQVQTIGAEAFSDCVAMTRLYGYCLQPPTCGASALEDIDKWNCILYIPKGTVSTYAEAEQWMDFFFVEENDEKGEGEYTISVDFDASKGSVTGAGVYHKGAEAVLIATPAEGCVFVEWEDGSTDPERHVYVYKSATYTATFSAPKYELYNGTDAVVKGVSAPNSIEIDHISYPNAIAYSYFATSDINLQDNVCGLNDDCDWYADNIVLTDAQPFYAPYDVEAKHVSYVRTFEDYNWQALYVPFDMKYSEFSNLARIAYLNNVHQYDDDDNGVIDRTVIECISLVDDNVEANWPYIVKPNSMGKITFNANNTTLHATESKEVECQSVFTRFNVFGTYQNTDVTNKYTIANGEFRPAESSQTVSPFRLYLIVSNKYASTPQPAPMRISFVIDGQEETDPTDVEVLYEDESTGEVYDILGRPVSRPAHGIFIRNGEKIFVR